jgi:hypothetical protein
MHRLRRLRRVPRSTIVLIALGLAMLAAAHFVPGSKPKLVHVVKLHSVPVDQTGWNDYLRSALWIGAALLFGSAGYRWKSSGERLVEASTMDPRAARTRVLGAQAQVDQAIGTSPLNYSGGG